MARNYINEGKTINFTNGTGSAIASGNVVPVGNQLCIALVDIAIGATGVLAAEGVFTVSKVTTAVIGQGESVMYDSSAKEFDDNLAAPAAGDISGCCIAVEAAGNGDTTVDIKLNVGVGAVA